MAFDLITTSGKRISLLNDKEPAPCGQAAKPASSPETPANAVLTPKSTPPMQGGFSTVPVNTNTNVGQSPSPSLVTPPLHPSVHLTPASNPMHYSYQSPRQHIQMPMQVPVQIPPAQIPTHMLNGSSSGAGAPPSGVPTGVSPGMSYEHAPQPTPQNGLHYPVIYYNTAPKDASLAHPHPQTPGLPQGVPQGVPQGLPQGVPMSNGYYQPYRADQNVLPPPPHAQMNLSNPPVFFSNYYPYSFAQQQDSYVKNMSTSPRLSADPPHAQPHQPHHHHHKFSVAPEPLQNPNTTGNTATKPVKRYTCHCMRSFTTSGHLARHMRIHTGEKNYKCPYEGCEAKFSRQDNCMQHYRTHMAGRGRLSRKRGSGSTSSASSSSSSASGSNPGSVSGPSSVKPSTTATATANETPAASPITSTKSGPGLSPSAKSPVSSSTPASAIPQKTPESAGSESPSSVSRTFVPLRTLSGSTPVISA